MTTNRFKILIIISIILFSVIDSFLLYALLSKKPQLDSSVVPNQTVQSISNSDKKDDNVKSDSNSTSVITKNTSTDIVTITDKTTKDNNKKSSTLPDNIVSQVDSNTAFENGDIVFTSKNLIKYDQTKVILTKTLLPYPSKLPYSVFNYKSDGKISFLGDGVISIDEIHNSKGIFKIVLGVDETGFTHVYRADENMNNLEEIKLPIDDYNPTSLSKKNNNVFEIKSSKGQKEVAYKTFTVDLTDIDNYLLYED